MLESDCWWPKVARKFGSLASWAFGSCGFWPGCDIVGCIGIGCEAALDLVIVGLFA